MDNDNKKKQNNPKKPKKYWNEIQKPSAWYALGLKMSAAILGYGLINWDENLTVRWRLLTIVNVIIKNIIINVMKVITGTKIHKSDESSSSR